LAEDTSLRIHHFVSDSNEDISNIAGKYHEAVTKLKQWIETEQQCLSTNALSFLLSTFSSGYFPGLPTLKKISIMHHLELIGKYLDQQDRDAH
jgi:hypothetical protein